MVSPSTDKRQNGRFVSVENTINLRNKLNKRKSHKHMFLGYKETGKNYTSNC
jgi:hypothetical protein